MPAKSGHIVKSFDEELQHLRDTVVRLGGGAESQLADAVAALSKRNSTLAGTVISNDETLDALERDIGDSAVRLLALRQPMANDLREVVSALKIGSDLERIGDYAANLAKRAIALNQLPMARPASAVPRMASLAQSIIKDTLDAFVRRDAQAAIDAWERDEELDEMYNGLFRELLTYMMEDPRNITPCTHLLFIAKNIERIGDHATNVCETIHYLVTGRQIEGGRPKGDKTSFQVVAPSQGNLDSEGEGKE
ncbi:MAG: phosphate signaling complex protein PhoU [Kiloniellales bacterium]